MKILIISDTHGSHKNFDRVIEKERPLDMLIHLGDVEGDEDYIPAVADCPVHMVRGNNDLWLPYGELRTARFEIGGVRFYMVHNREEAGEVPEETDVVVFGHTHQYYEKKENGRLWLNPGSCGRARFSLPLTMAVMTIHEGRWRVHRVRIDA